MPTATNKLLCDTMIAPDGSIVVIEDAGAAGVSGTYVHAGIDPSPETTQRALWVHTMNVHECDLVDRRVRVRVLAGDLTADLGDLAFDGHLNIARDCWPSAIAATPTAKYWSSQLPRSGSAST